MFGMSFGKLLVLAIIVLVVWYAFKYVTRVEEVKRALRRAVDEKRQAAQPAPRPPAAEDLVKCIGCGAYVTSHGAAPCGRAECPWR